MAWQRVVEQFVHLRRYAKEIMFTNKGSTFIVDTCTNTAGEHVFSRFYVWFANFETL